MDFEVNLEGLVDTEEEKKRLKKQVAQIEKDLAHFQKKLSSEAFLEKAPSALIEKERQKCAELEKELLIAQESLLRITHLS
jgi:valyl-tRNA synthetase